MSLKKSVQSKARQIQIQVGVCKRMLKEVSAYEKEVITNEARVQKMRDDDKDTYDIRKQEEVLQESYMMIPDSKGRLESAMSMLNQIMRDFAQDEEDSTEVDGTLIQDASSILSSYFGSDTFGESFRSAPATEEIQKPPGDALSPEEEDVEFPDEK